MQDKVVSFLIKHCSKVGEPLTSIGVLDLYDSSSMKLSQMRKEIHKSWSDIQFQFLEKQKFPIGRGNEEMKLLKTILSKSLDESESGYSIIDILVKNQENSSLGLQQKVKETHDRELLVSESIKNKEKIQESLKCLQAFSKKMDSASQKNNEEYRKEVSELQENLKKNHNIQINFSTNFQKELKAAHDILNSKKWEQVDIIQHFSKIQPVNIKEMLTKNEASLMRSYYKGKVVHYHVSNIEACTFEYAQIGYDVTQRQCTFVSQEQRQLLDSKMEKEKKRYAASLGIENIWARLEAGLEVCNSKGNSSGKEASEKYESSLSQKTIVYIGECLTFSLDSVKLKSEVVNEFVQLYNCFTQIKKASDNGGEVQKKRQIFKKKVIEYYQRYGNEIELGAYSFGSTYEADSTLNFQGKLSKSQIKTVAATCLNVNVRGGVTFSSFINVGGSFEKNNQSSSKDKQSEGSQSINYSCTSSFKAYPLIKNYQQWGKIVAKNRSFWKIVKTQLQLVKLIKIIKSHQNRPSFFNDDDNDVHNFEQQIEDILEDEKYGRNFCIDERTRRYTALSNQYKNQDLLSSNDGKTIRIKHQILFYSQCLPKCIKSHKKVFKIESGITGLGLLFYNSSSELETMKSTQLKLIDVSKLKNSIEIQGGEFLFINANTNDEVSFFVNLESQEVEFAIKGEKKDKSYKPKLTIGGRFVSIGAQGLEEAAVIKQIG